ncbi:MULTISPECIES: hypothetical protein [Pantoea]|nr:MULTISPECIES: hypothetical protein [Pantoea]MDI3413687.1 hypothetical protein [Pantoea sp. V106_11]
MKNCDMPYPVAVIVHQPINYTPEQKAIIWDRYKQGDSMYDI